MFGSTHQTHKVLLRDIGIGHNLWDKVYGTCHHTNTTSKSNRRNFETQAMRMEDLGIVLITHSTTNKSKGQDHRTQVRRVGT